MSIHRPKRVSFRSNAKESSESPFDTAKDVKAPTWAEAVADKSDEDFKAYSVAVAYAQGDLLRHPKFGNGVVAGVEGKKIDVVFEDATRKLAHGMG